MFAKKPTMAFVELKKHHSARAPGTESLRSSVCATEQRWCWASLSGVQPRRRGCHAWRLPGSVRSKSQLGFVESVNAQVAGTSPQQMLKMLRPLLLEMCTRPRLHCTQVRPLPQSHGGQQNALRIYSTSEEKFQVSCTTYLALNRTKTCSFPELHWHRLAGPKWNRTEGFVWSKTTGHCYRACVAQLDNAVLRQNLGDANSGLLHIQSSCFLRFWM